MKYNPHKYQERAVQFLLDNKSAALLLDMGLGKTVITLTALNELLRRGEARKILVIAPKMVAESTWSDEAAKWEHLSNLTLERLTGGKNARIRALQEKADIYVIGRDNVAWLVENYSWDFDTLVIDELSSFKNPSTKRFKALKKVRNKINRVIGLTGTPSANGLMDLWAEIYLLDKGERLGRTLTFYRRNYFKPGMILPSGIVCRWEPLPGSQKAIEEKLSDICLSMSAADYLELPECIYNIVPVKLTKNERAVYMQMKRDRVFFSDGDEAWAVNAAAAMNKLLQMANGRVYGENGVITIHNEKLEKLKELADTTDEPMLVFYNFRHDIDAIKSVLPDARLFEGKKDIEDWNAGKIRVLLAHPASAGYGINMQGGGRVIVWYGLTWSLEQYQQANARLYRQGQEKPVIIHHLITEGTVDERVMQALNNKETGQAALLEALKAEKGEERKKAG